MLPNFCHCSFKNCASTMVKASLKQIAKWSWTFVPSHHQILFSYILISGITCWTTTPRWFPSKWFPLGQLILRQLPTRVKFPQTSPHSRKVTLSRVEMGRGLSGCRGSRSIWKIKGRAREDDSWNYCCLKFDCINYKNCIHGERDKEYMCS